MKNFFFIVLLILSINLFGDNFRVSYRAPESDLDIRFDYALELIKEAMKKTKDKYGDYELMAAPNMNFKRAQEPKYIEKLENFIFESNASKENEKNLLSVKIPIAKGLYGYRIFLINQNKKDLFKEIKNVEDLKKIRIGQGKNWLDVKILKEENFDVVLGNNYEGLFHMLINDRFDAFSRGVNEAYSEKEKRIEILPDLTVEETICLYYPLPRYFYTSKKNILLVERITEGLEIMIKDGSFDNIWKKYHDDILNKANLSKRKIFRIKNNHIPDSVPLDEKKYWYFPDKDSN